MPALFALSLARAPRALRAELTPGESARAFLDSWMTSTLPASQAARPSCLISCKFTSSSKRAYTSTLQKRLEFRQRPAARTPVAPRRGTSLGWGRQPPRHGQIRCILIFFAWPLLLYCARPRAQYLLRILPPALTAAYAAEHVRSAQLLQVEASPDSFQRQYVIRTR